MNLRSDALDWLKTSSHKPGSHEYAFVTRLVEQIEKLTCQADAPNARAFFLNGQMFWTDKPSATAAQILAVSGHDARYHLMQEGEGDTPDRQLRLDESVCFTNPGELLSFYAAPDGTIGG